MLFEVPQFLDIETKVVGPLGFKGLIYVIGSVAALLGAVWLFGFIIGLIVSMPLVILGILLAFYRPNNRPFVYMIEAFIKYFASAKKYRWMKTQINNPHEQLIKDINVAQKNLQSISKKSGLLDASSNKS